MLKLLNSHPSWYFSIKAFGFPPDGLSYRSPIGFLSLKLPPPPCAVLPGICDCVSINKFVDFTVCKDSHADSSFTPTIIIYIDTRYQKKQILDITYERNI